jgi:hypothetical protein
MLTKKGTPDAALSELLKGIPADDVKKKTSFDNLQVQVVLVNLDDATAKDFGANPIVSVAFSNLR